ncbi:MAG: MBL fold metallo-hydrolase [Pseudomonadota bacterium]
MKKWLLIFVLGILMLGYLFRGELSLRLMERVVTSNMAGSLLDELEDGLHVILCGAGSPLPDPMRSGPCTAVVAGEQLLIFDTGAGANGVMGQLRLPQGDIDAIFLTHFHSDHIDGLGELMMQRWVGGTHQTPLGIYGPTGVERVVNAFNAAYAQDDVYRTAQHGEAIAPSGGKDGNPIEFTTPLEGELTVVYEQDGVIVSSFAVDHFPVVPAVGYRVDYGGRSVVISGDTVRSANLEALSFGVDVLVHEALSPELVMLINRGAEANGRDNIATIAIDILDYHTTPVEAAQSAAETDAGYLLLTHIVPPLPISTLEKPFLRGVSDVYSGDVKIGKDGSMVSLPSNSEQIVASELLY